MKRTLCAIILVLMLSAMLSGCGLSEPRPKIKTGEFNFSVTYEYLGEVNTVSGVYVCEYDGIGWVLDGGYYRSWSGYIKGNTTEENIVLGTAEDGGVVELFLAFNPDRFMGDYYWEEDEPFVPCLSVRIIDEGLSFESDPVIVEEVYGAKVISYEYDEPIENTFYTVFGE